MQAFDSESQKPVHGNTCLYFLYMIANLALCLIGLGTIAVGIYLCTETKTFDWFNGSFILVGLLTVCVAWLGCHTRYSSVKIFFYVMLLIPIFLVQLGFSVGLILYTSDFAEIVAQHGSSENFNQLKKKAEQHAQQTEIYLIVACCIIFSCIGISCWYRGNLSDERFMNELRKSFDRKNSGTNGPTPKNDEKRQLLYQKYPALEKKAKDRERNYQRL